MAAINTSCYDKHSSLHQVSPSPQTTLTALSLCSAASQQHRKGTSICRGQFGHGGTMTCRRTDSQTDTQFDSCWFLPVTELLVELYDAARGTPALFGTET
jgi:hypothetical protein